MIILWVIQYWNVLSWDVHTALIVIRLLSPIHIFKAKKTALNLIYFFNSVIFWWVFIDIVLKKTLVASLEKLMNSLVRKIWKLFLIDCCKISKWLLLLKLTFGTHKVKLLSRLFSFCINILFIFASIHVKWRLPWVYFCMKVYFSQTYFIILYICFFI